MPGKNSKPIVFAVSQQDCRAACRVLKKDFEDVVFVLAPELLGTTTDRSEAPVYCTEMYRKMPVYNETEAEFRDRIVNL